MDAVAPHVAVAEDSAVTSLDLAYMSLHLVTTLSNSLMSYSVEYMARGILDLIMLTTVASLYSSCLAVSWTFLRNTSMSSVFGSKEKEFHLVWRFLMDLP